MLTRADAVAALGAREFDVLVVGGGITGAGVALDAASRGLRTGLVERHDYSWGTSSRSSKLIHGGLRYLQSLDLALVREALVERRINAAIAPHIVHALPIVVPALRGFRDPRTGLGLTVYDAMAAEAAPFRRGRPADDHPSLSRHRVLAGSEVEELLPALASRTPRSGHLLYDGQTDDARLVLSILQGADRLGAVCANRVELRSAEDRHGRVAAACVYDHEAGAEFTIRTRYLVNATGIWAGQLQSRRASPGPAPAIRPSRGTHIVVASRDLPVRAGAIVPAPGRRTIFVLPWLGSTLIGTTDVDQGAATDPVRADAGDADYLLAAVNEFFGLSLQRADVTGAFAGARPLVAGADGAQTTDLSRRAVMADDGRGFITITGGKLTTWRRMAELVVDRIARRERLGAACVTHRLMLGQRIAPEDLPAIPEFGTSARRHLANRYGVEAREVMSLGASEPELARPVLDGHADVMAEVAYAVRHEQARTVADVLLRRTRLGLLNARGLEDRPEVARRVAGTLGDHLGWDDARRSAEAAAFAAEARREGLVIEAPGAARRREQARR